VQLRSIRSAIAAASLLSLVQAPAFAQAAAKATPSAVATGLAIPIAGIPNRSPPLPSRGRAVLVDASSARLYMIENGQVVDSMRVIVGKPTSATPVMRSTLFYATLNPYWNVPLNLARTIVAPNVLKYGTAYLRDRGYEVVSGFKKGAEVLPAGSVDWQAVADGSAKAYVRQRPGPANSMGRMKFWFPNNDGIFLHDTPKKELFAEENRYLSNGCVRLEDASRFGRWLLGRDPDSEGAGPEQYVPLPAGVPIVITYLDPGAPVHMAALR
jgi:murein L,D-transpeptidase YcbB/YkuD